MRTKRRNTENEWPPPTLGHGPSKHVETIRGQTINFLETWCQEKLTSSSAPVAAAAPPERANRRRGLSISLEAAYKHRAVDAREGLEEARRACVGFCVLRIHTRCSPRLLSTHRRPRSRCHVRHLLLRACFSCVLLRCPSNGCHLFFTIYGMTPLTANSTITSPRQRKIPKDGTYPTQQHGLLTTRQSS